MVFCVFKYGWLTWIIIILFIFFIFVHLHNNTSLQYIKKLK